jgi:hypothetical protein
VSSLHSLTLSIRLVYSEPMGQKRKPKQTPNVSSAAQALGRRGGTARAKALTADQRREIARQGARARWGMRKPTE